MSEVLSELHNEPLDHLAEKFAASPGRELLWVLTGRR